MKKLLHLFLSGLTMLLSYNLMAQNVGIGTTTPTAKLHIINNDATVPLRLQNLATNSYTGIHFHAADGTLMGHIGFANPAAPTLANSFYAGSIGDAPFIFTTNDAERMRIDNSGNVGIGTSAPLSKLTVQTTTNNFGIAQTDGTITVGTYVGLGMGWFGTKSNHPLAFFTNNGGTQMTLLTNGNLGIGFSNPVNKVQIGSMGATGFNGNDLAIGNGANALGISQTNTVAQFGSSTDIILMPKIFSSGAGRVGINVLNPANKLQIGSMGAAGFNGNDLAIGNGTNALGIYQSNTATQIGSSTDIILMPRINGGGVGRVGINTATPRVPLDVMNGINVNALSNFYTFINQVTYGNGLQSSHDDPVPNVSIIASGRVYAEEFDAYSDARIKNIIGASNTKKDLQTLNALRITDYTMKDKVQHGNKSYKKVIAQEVEKVYPQVVSKHTDFIPNVYQLASKVEKTATGYVLSFANKHNISSTAKKLRVILSEGGTAEMNIVSVPSETQVIVNGKDIKADKLFVYGEEVDDFRTVDYEGLTTLNISATQELSKLIDAQNKKIAQLEEEIKLMKEKTNKP